MDSETKDRKDFLVKWINYKLGPGTVDHSGIMEALRDGVILCKLVNSICRGLIPQIHHTHFESFKQRENIHNYLEASKTLGLSDVDNFETADLYEKNDEQKVYKQLMTLASVAADSSRSRSLSPPVVARKRTVSNPKLLCSQDKMQINLNIEITAAADAMQGRCTSQRRTGPSSRSKDDADLLRFDRVHQTSTGDPKKTCQAHLILPYLYVGCVRSSQDRRKLMQLGVSFILNCSEKLPCPFKNDFTYKQLMLVDKEEQKIYQLFEEVNVWIDEARLCKKTVFVHCQQGMSRSISFLLAYMMWKQKVKLADAYWACKRKRWCTSPNPGFMAQLAQYELQLHPHMSSPSIDPAEYDKERFGKFWPEELMDASGEYTLWCGHALDRRGFVEAMTKHCPTSPASPAVLRSNSSGNPAPATTTLPSPSASAESGGAHASATPACAAAAPAARTADVGPPDFVNAIPFEELEVERELGEGTFGKVSLVYHAPTRSKYAMKQVKSSDVKGRLAFIKEANLSVNLSHPSLLSVKGFYVRDGAMYILLPFMQGGGLDGMLQSVFIPLSWGLRIRMLLGVAQALEYLHANNIIHRDVKAENVLIGEDECAVLADLGLARKFSTAAGKTKKSIQSSGRLSYNLPQEGKAEQAGREDSRRRRMTVCGTTFTMAPEVFALHGGWTSEYDERADIFSFGMLLWEVVTRARHSDLDRTDDFGVDKELVLKSFPPDEGCPARLVQLAVDCTKVEPALRPSLGKAISVLKSLAISNPVQNQAKRESWHFSKEQNRKMKQVISSFQLKPTADEAHRQNVTATLEELKDRTTRKPQFAPTDGCSEVSGPIRAAPRLPSRQYNAVNEDQVVALTAHLLAGLPHVHESSGPRLDSARRSISCRKFMTSLKFHLNAQMSEVLKCEAVIKSRLQDYTAAQLALGIDVQLLP